MSERSFSNEAKRTNAPDFQGAASGNNSAFLVILEGNALPVCASVTGLYIHSLWTFFPPLSFLPLLLSVSY